MVCDQLYCKKLYSQAYWVNTGKNEILEDVLKVATDDIIEKLYSLLQGEKNVARIDLNVVYHSLIDEPANIYSLLLAAGYLKVLEKRLQADGSYLCEVCIPNKERWRSIKMKYCRIYCRLELSQEQPQIKLQKVFT